MFRQKIKQFKNISIILLLQHFVVKLCIYSSMQLGLSFY